MLKSIKQLHQAYLRDHPPTADQEADLKNVLLVVKGWLHEGLPLEEAINLTGGRTGRDRSILRKLDPDHQQYGDCLLFLDAVIDHTARKMGDPIYQTAHGAMRESEIKRNNGRVTTITNPETGENSYRIQFAIGNDVSGNPIWPTRESMVVMRDHVRLGVPRDDPTRTDPQERDAWERIGEGL